MPLDASLVGTAVGQIDTVCDVRWAMAYAAGVPDERPELFDTTQPLLVHPLFPVAPEWELLTTHRTVVAAMPQHEVIQGVHASHDLVLLRRIPIGDSVTLRAVVVGVDRRPAGAAQQTMFEATGADGLPIWRTLLTSVFRGVELEGDPASIDVDWPAPPIAPATSGAAPRPVAVWPSRVRSVDAHVYTECARIWNPIHTDVAVARAAGLPDPILHGSATLARAVSLCTAPSVDGSSGVSLGNITRVGGSFAATVALDSTIQVRLLSRQDRVLHFDVLNDQDHPAIRGGFIEWRSPAAE